MAYHATPVPPTSGQMTPQYFEDFMNTTIGGGLLITILDHGRLVLIWKD